MNVFFVVLAKSGDETVRLEDLDSLQTELETLLVSVVKRQMTIESEMDALVTWQEKPKDKKPVLVKVNWFNFLILFVNLCVSIQRAKESKENL